MANVTTLANVAMKGDINMLYCLIQGNPYILEPFDEMPFANTPLHLAAATGNLPFAMEIMRLKPSFALKLNPEGDSPIHVALQENHIYLACCLVDINKDLVRVKGKEDLTPLHFVCKGQGQAQQTNVNIEDQAQAQQNNVNIVALIYFLEACPDSIEDVNVRGQTALHIAIESGNLRALQVLLCWLKKNTRKGALSLEHSILNMRDHDGNTISAQLEDDRVQEGAKLIKLKYLVPRQGRVVHHDASYEQKLISRPTLIQKLVILSCRIGNDVSSEERSVYMVVASLLLAAVYQSAVNPPGGVYPAENGLNTTSPVNSTTTAEAGKPGKSILGNGDFNALTLFNTEVLFMTVMITLVLMPKGKAFFLYCVLVHGFAGSYLYTVTLISPNSRMKTFSIVLMWIMVIIYPFLIIILTIKPGLKIAWGGWLKRYIPYPRTN